MVVPILLPLFGDGVVWFPLPSLARSQHIQGVTTPVELIIELGVRDAIVKRGIEAAMSCVALEGGI